MASNYEPLTPAQAERRMRECSRRLLEAIDEHGQACEEEASAIADFEDAYQAAMIRSELDHPKRRVAMHEAYAKAEAMPLRRASLAATARRRALGEEMHSLRQVLSSIQTNARAMQAAS